MTELYCRHCGVSFKRQALFAMLIDLGARGSNPVYCHKSPDEKHEFINEDTDPGSQVPDPRET